MAQTVELEAKSVEQAVKQACDRLEISPERLKYDVISYGSTGIFGIGKNKKAKIRVVMSEGQVWEHENKDAGGGGDSAEDTRNRLRDLIDETLNDGRSESGAETDPRIDMGKDVLQRIVDNISSGAEVTVEKSEENVLYNVEGGNSAVLIGRHGQTLDAMQSLVEKIVNKQNASRVRVQVDIEGYRESRKKNLIRHAESLADKCKRIRRPVTVGHMNAHDRRIVHMALKGDAKVRTRSSGDGFMRKLVIYPSSASARRRSP
jgi:spoIIIJ-associated protein